MLWMAADAGEKRNGVAGSAAQSHRYFFPRLALRCSYSACMAANSRAWSGFNSLRIRSDICWRMDSN